MSVSCLIRLLLRGSPEPGARAKPSAAHSISQNEKTRPNWSDTFVPVNKPNCQRPTTSISHIVLQCKRAHQKLCDTAQERSGRSRIVLLFLVVSPTFQFRVFCHPFQVTGNFKWRQVKSIQRFVCNRKFHNINLFPPLLHIQVLIY